MLSQWKAPTRRKRIQKSGLKPQGRGKEVVFRGYDPGEKEKKKKNSPAVTVETRSTEWSQGPTSVGKNGLARGNA